MSDAGGVGVAALAVNVVIPEELRWVDVRRDVEFELQTLTVRVLKDGSLAAKAYGRPTGGGRGAYTSFDVRWSPELERLVDDAAQEAARIWAGARVSG